MVEIIAVISSLLCVYLTAKKNNLCWPIGIIGVLGYMWIFYQGHQYANIFLQFVFLGQSLFAWWKWNTNDIILPSVNEKVFGILIFVFGLFLYIIGIGILDMTTTLLSLMGMYLLAYKKYKAWYYWITADVLYILMFAIGGQLLPMFNYIIFLGLATWGLIKWRKEDVI